MKSLFLIPMALGTLLLASCADTMAAKCGKCGKAGCTMCEKSGAKCMCGKTDCTTCKG
jgi:hypothetical protein